MIVVMPDNTASTALNKQGERVDTSGLNAAVISPPDTKESTEMQRKQSGITTTHPKRKRGNRKARAAEMFESWYLVIRKTAEVFGSRT